MARGGKEIKVFVFPVVCGLLFNTCYWDVLQLSRWDY